MNHTIETLKEVIGHLNLYNLFSCEGSDSYDPECADNNIDKVKEKVSALIEQMEKHAPVAYGDRLGTHLQSVFCIPSTGVPNWMQSLTPLYTTPQPCSRCAELEAELSAIQFSVAKVYMEVTNGKCSMENTAPEVVIALFEDYLSERIREETAALEAEVERLNVILLSQQARGLLPDVPLVATVYGMSLEEIAGMRDTIAQLEAEVERLTASDTARFNQAMRNGQERDTLRRLVYEREATIAKQAEKIRELENA